MGEGRSEERRFLDDLDRLLAGEETTPGEETSADHVSAIEFARKLAGLNEGPSAEFQQQLKQRLLLKLTERDVAARQAVRAGGFRRLLDSLVPRSPVWRTAAVAVTIVLVTAGVMWGTGMFTAVPEESELATMQAESGLKKGLAAPEAALAPRVGTAQDEAEEAAAPEKAPMPPLPEITLSIPTAPAEPVVSAQGEDVVIRWSFTNPTAELMTVKQWPPAFNIVPRGDRRTLRVLPAGDAVVEIAASGTLEYTLTWDQKDGQGQQVPPGYYLIMPGEILLEGEDGQDILISGPAIRLLVLFPQGAMEKSIEVNRTVTVGGNSASLERVELSALGISVYVLVTLPDYSPPPPAAAMTPPSPSLPVSGHYSVDGGPRKELRGNGQRYVNHDIEDDIALSWTELDPVPSDARILTFTITRMGEWQGPWEFVIPLQD